MADCCENVEGAHTYKGEGELASVTAGSATVLYTYDGGGNRVQKANSGTPPSPYKLYWYGGGIDPLSESDASGNITEEYIFFNGRRAAMLTISTSAVDYYVEDQIGSSRVVTNSSGVVQDDSDFTPYGTELSYSSGSGNHYKFTGKERDTETGLDDFAARFYTSQFGRFMSADDSKYMVAADPQTLNLYSYVANNPINAVDPTGHSAIGIGPVDVPYAPPAGGGGYFGGCMECESTFNSSNAIDNNESTANSGSRTVYLIYRIYENGKPVDVLKTTTYDEAVATLGASVFSHTGAANIPAHVYKPYKHLDPVYGQEEGLIIEILAQIGASNYESFNWVQIVTTNDPSPDKGQPANEPFLDREKDQPSPFYWTATQKQKYDKVAMEHGGSAYFRDRTWKVFSGTLIVWHADLFLVGINKDGTFGQLKSFSYSFTVDSKGAHLGKLEGIK
jgi:RHS repeat-associated protein